MHDRALHAHAFAIDHPGGVPARLGLFMHALELLCVRAFQVVEKRLVECLGHKAQVAFVFIFQIEVDGVGENV